VPLGPSLVLHATASTWLTRRSFGRGIDSRSARASRSTVERCPDTVRPNAALRCPNFFWSVLADALELPQVGGASYVGRMGPCQTDTGTRMRSGNVPLCTE
jgi:hypothetical protein